MENMDFLPPTAPSIVFARETFSVDFSTFEAGHTQWTCLPFSPEVGGRR